MKDLADYVRQAPNELGSPEALAKRADTAVKRAAEQFTPQQARSIMAEMGRPPGAPTSRD